MVGDKEESVLITGIYKGRSFHMLQNLILATSKNVKNVECRQLNKTWTTNLAQHHAYFLTVYINLSTINPETNSVKVHVRLATNPLTKPLKIAGNASKVFLESVLRSFDSLFNQFCKAHLSFVGDDPEVSGPPPPSKIPIIAKTIVQMVLL